MREDDPVIGPRGRDMIRRHEGLCLTAYRCPSGKPTIGYGSTRGVQMGETITREDAERRLEADLSDAEAAIDNLVRVKLTESMRDALASWIFNLGRGSFRISTMLRRINASDYAAVPTEMKRWVWAKNPATGGLVTLPGLVKRRNEEAALFLADGIPGGTDGSTAA